MPDPYASGVLDPDVHSRLVADMSGVARDANIMSSWIWTPLAETCGAEEIDWVRKFKFHAPENHSGLCYVGHDDNTPIEDRMSAVAGALTRNFIRARVITLSQFVQASTGADFDALDISCLLIPNFFTGEGGQAAWRVEQMLDALIQRHNRGLQTVVAVSNWNSAEVGYGLAMMRHIESYFQVIAAGKA